MALIDSNFFGDLPFEIVVPPRRIKVRVENAENGGATECKASYASISYSAEKSRFEAYGSAEELYARFTEYYKSQLSNMYDDDDVRRQRLTKKGASEQQFSTEQAEVGSEQAGTQNEQAKTRSQRLWELRYEALSYRSEFEAANKATISRRDESYNDKIARMRNSIYERQQQTAQQLAEKERYLYLKQVQKSAEQRTAFKNAKMKDEQRLQELKERQSLEQRSRSLSTHAPARMRSSGIKDASADAIGESQSRAKSRGKGLPSGNYKRESTGTRELSPSKSPNRYRSAPQSLKMSKEGESYLYKPKGTERADSAGQRGKLSPKAERSASSARKVPSRGSRLLAEEQPPSSLRAVKSPRAADYQVGTLAHDQGRDSKRDLKAESGSPRAGSRSCRVSAGLSGYLRGQNSPGNKSPRDGLSSRRLEAETAPYPHSARGREVQRSERTGNARASTDRQVVEQATGYGTDAESRAAQRKNATPRKNDSPQRAASAQRAHISVTEDRKARQRDVSRREKPSSQIEGQIIAELATKRTGARLTNMEQRIQAAKRELLRQKGLIRQDELQKAQPYTESARVRSAQQSSLPRRKSSEYDASFDARASRSKEQRNSRLAASKSPAALLNTSNVSEKARRRTPQRQSIDSRRENVYQAILEAQKLRSAKERPYSPRSPQEDRHKAILPLKGQNAADLPLKSYRSADYRLKGENSTSSAPKSQKSVNYLRETPRKQHEANRTMRAPDPDEQASVIATTPKKARSIEKHFLDVQAQILAEMAHIQPERTVGSAQRRQALNPDAGKSAAKFPTPEQQKPAIRAAQAEKSQLEKYLDRYEAAYQSFPYGKRTGGRAILPSKPEKPLSAKSKTAPGYDSKRAAESVQKHNLEAERRASLVKQMLSQQHDITESARKKARQVEAEARSLRYAENTQKPGVSPPRTSARISLGASASHRQGYVRGDYLIRWLDSLVSDEKIIAITTISTGRTVYQNVPRLQYEQLRGIEGAEVVRKLTKAK